MLSRKRLSLLAAAVAVVAAVAFGATAGSSHGTLPLTNAKHFFWAGQTPDPNALQNDLIYHGGNVGTANPIGVLTKPAAYLVYWGTEWQQGFTTADTDGKLFSSKTLQTYTNSFLSKIGG